MANEETKTIEILSVRDELITTRNQYTKKLIFNILDLKRYWLIKTIDPEYAEKDAQNNRYTVDNLISIRKANAANAKSYIDTIDELLKQDEAKTISKVWDGIVESAEGVDFGDEERAHEKELEDSKELTDDEKAENVKNGLNEDGSAKDAAAGGEGEKKKEDKGDGPAQV